MTHERRRRPLRIRRVPGGPLPRIELRPPLDPARLRGTDPARLTLADVVDLERWSFAHYLGTGRGERRTIHLAQILRSILSRTGPVQHGWCLVRLDPSGRGLEALWSDSLDSQGFPLSVALRPSQDEARAVLEALDLP